MSNHCQIKIHRVDEEQQDLLVAILSEQGYEGFEQSEKELRAYIPESLFTEDILNDLAKEHSFNWHMTIIPKQNWNEVWESNFEPVQVDDFAGIRANFHPPFGNVQHDIVITPKMSFGTGHHATTYMVMQLMRKLDFADKSVFDFGSGTGILAILAEKLGATKVLAVDNDEWCIENATENVHINECTHIEVSKIDILTFDEKFDIILANINRNIILENIHILKQGLAKNGNILFSGLLKEDEKDIHAACQSIGFQHKATIEKGGWIALWYF